MTNIFPFDQYLIEKYQIDYVEAFNIYLAFEGLRLAQPDGKLHVMAIKQGLTDYFIRKIVCDIVSLPWDWEQLDNDQYEYLRELNKYHAIPLRMNLADWVDFNNDKFKAKNN